RGDGLGNPGHRRGEAGGKPGRGVRRRPGGRARGPGQCGAKRRRRSGPDHAGRLDEPAARRGGPGGGQHHRRRGDRAGSRRPPAGPAGRSLHRLRGHRPPGGRRGGGVPRGRAFGDRDRAGGRVGGHHRPAAGGGDVSEAPRFFAGTVQRAGPGFVAWLPEDEAHHAARVLRLRPGDAAIVLDDSGYEHVGAVAAVELSRGRVSVRVEGSVVRPAAGEPRVAVTLIQALPKGDKMDTIVQKGTETGVARFVPARSERVVVEYTGAKAEQRRARWQKIANEAAKQARRGRRPVVEPVAELLDAVAARRGEEVLVLWEQAETPLKSVLRELRSRGSRRVALVVGAE